MINHTKNRTHVIAGNPAINSMQKSTDRIGITGPNGTRKPRCRSGSRYLRTTTPTETSTNAVSNYNGAVVFFKHQFTRWNGGLIQASYTYGPISPSSTQGAVRLATSASCSSGK